MITRRLADERELRRRTLETLERLIVATEANLPRLARLSDGPGAGHTTPRELWEMLRDARLRLERLRERRARLLAREGGERGPARPAARA